MHVQSGISLDRLEGISVALLDFGEAMDNALLPGERAALRFIALAWSLVRIKHQIKPLNPWVAIRGTSAWTKKLKAMMVDARRPHLKRYEDLQSKVRALIAPPVPRFGLAEYVHSVAVSWQCKKALREHLLERIAFYRRPTEREDGKIIPGLGGNAALQRAIADFGRPLRKTDQPSRDDFRLEELETISRKFIRLCEAIRHPLLPSMRTRFAWLLRAWDSPYVKAELLAVAEDRLARDDELVKQLHTWLDPIADQRPHRPISDRLRRFNAVAVAERTEGNFALKKMPFEGDTIRPLGHADIAERLALMLRDCEGVGSMLWEIALASPSDRLAAAPILEKIEQLVTKDGPSFTHRCEALTLRSYAVLVVNQETGRREYVDLQGRMHSKRDGVRLLTWKDAKKLAAEWNGDIVDARVPTLEEDLDAGKLMAELL